MKADITESRMTGLVFAIALLATALSARASDPAVPLVVDGQPQATIVLGSAATEQEKFAADELKDYVQRMTSAELRVITVGALKSTPGAVVLIGRPETHHAIKELTQAGRVDYSRESLTDEGFVLQTTKLSDRPCVVIAGGGDTGTIYGVYDALERFGRVGFFRYEEHVPKAANFAIPQCNIQQRPYFKTRMHGGQYHYYGIHFFSEAQWQENLRWYAKYRLNRTNYIPGPPPGEQAMAGIWQRMGISPSSAGSSSELALTRKLSSYGLKLGVRAPYVSTDGELAPAMVGAFRAKYPNAKYMVVNRGDRQHTYVHPDDPLWLKLNQAFIESYVEQYGDGRVFGLPSPYPELSPGETREEQDSITKAYAEAVGRLAEWAESKYPGAEWVWDGWAFANKQYWEPHRVQRLFEALPPSLNMIIWDYPAEDEPSYVFQNYWHGRPWAFVVCHSMAGNATVHGDVNRIAGNVFRVLCDQRADKNLRGFGHYTEANDYVPFFQDYILHLAWDPFRNVDEFVVDYCQRRYAAESVDAMVACHQKLLKTVYGPESDTHLTDGFRTVRLQDPIYWFALGGNWVPFDDLQHRMTRLRLPWLPLLRAALGDALSVYDREHDNVAYRRDLVDIMRSYVQVRMNQSIWDAAQAARQGNSQAFDENHSRTERLFEHLLAAVGLVADRWEFGVDAMVKDFADAPIVRSPEEIRHHLYYVTFGGDRIYDYFRSDRYEMIRDIYRPLTMAALNGLRDRMGEDPANSVAPPQSAAGYDTIMDVVAEKAHVASSTAQNAIIERFIQGPCPPPPAAGDPRAVAEKFLAAIDKGDI